MNTEHHPEPRAIHPFPRYDKDSGDYHIFWPVEDGLFMSVNFGDDGIVMDVYSVDEDGNDFLSGTVGMMYDEWLDWVVGQASPDPRYEGEGQ